jgi:hypothetical protein
MLACLYFFYYILNGSCVLDDEDIILRYATLLLHENHLPYHIHINKVIPPLMLKLLCIVSL